jgi:hypothetical protein
MHEFQPLLIDRLTFWSLRFWSLSFGHWQFNRLTIQLLTFVGVDNSIIAFSTLTFWSSPVFVHHISGSQWPCLFFSTSCHATYRRGTNRRVSRETPGEALSPVPPYPPKKQKNPKPKNKKWGRALLLLFLDCIDTLPISPVGLVSSCHCPWPCCCSASSCCCRICPPASVQRGSVYRPRSRVQGFPYPCRKLRARKLWCTCVR